IAQLSDLNRILALRELGFSLLEIQTLVSNIGLEELKELLAVRSSKLKEQIDEARANLQFVEARLRMIEQEGKVIDDIVIRSLPAVRVAAIAKPARGFGPDNLEPILKPAYRELADLCRTA